jgi:hypothetical protein
MHCDSARLNLYHIKGEDGNLNADGELKGWLGMDRKGFKWKTLINGADGLRYQVMQINRP